MSDKLTLTISNDLWSTEIGEYVTGQLLGVPPEQWLPQYKVARPARLGTWLWSASVGEWTFERESFVIDGTRLELWKRVK